MSEMVERVAIAQTAERDLWVHPRDARFLTRGILVGRRKPDGAAGEYTNQYTFKTLEEAEEGFELLRASAVARAAIAAMREPTEAMCAAGYLTVRPIMEEMAEPNPYDHGIAWQAMIDEALKE